MFLAESIVLYSNIKFSVEMEYNDRNDESQNASELDSFTNDVNVALKRNYV